MSREEYIEQYKDFAISKMRDYKIPASITLAQGILESASGNSVLAVKANNHFGIKCKKEWTGKSYNYDDDLKNECFRAYASVKESYDDHALFLTTRVYYKDLFTLEITDYKSWAHGLQSAGYATHPRYAQTLINLIEQYNLSFYDRIGLYQVFLVDSD
jgi:flagellum-specific peptidoglycan hydrolase FlgJ